MRASAKISVTILIVAAFVAGVFFATGTGIFQTNSSMANGKGLFQADALPALEINNTDDLSTAYARVAEFATPRVVQIVTKRSRDSGQRENPFQGTPFEEFFQGPQRQRDLPPQTGLGSGVVIRENGYIVTNNHVVQGADNVEVHMADGGVYDGEIVGTDPTSDLAVVKIDAENLDVIPFSEIGEIKVGHWVMAVGSPFSQELGNSITTGIISATGRSGLGIGSSEAGPGQFAPVQNFIQTDAAINPGNSGGALVDLHGRLVGINTAIISRSGGSVGIGFAIPIDIVKNAVRQIIEQGYVSRGYLGINFGPIPSSLAQALDITRGAAQVSQVVPDSPADQAGLQAGDVIISLGGQTLENASQLANIVGNKQPGEELEVTFIRDEEEQTVTVELGERPNGEQQAQNQQEEEDQQEPTSGATTIEGLGLELTNLNSDLRQRLELSEDVQGILITNVDRSSMAFNEANLQRGLIITEVNSQAVSSVEEFQNIYNDVEAGDYFRLQVVQPTPEGVSTFLTALVKPE